MTGIVLGLLSWVKRLSRVLRIGLSVTWRLKVLVMARNEQVQGALARENRVAALASFSGGD